MWTRLISFAVIADLGHNFRDVHNYQAGKNTLSTQRKSTTRQTEENVAQAKSFCADKTTSTCNARWQSLALRSATIQPKLAINQPGDAYEQEADQMAEQVMAAPALSDSPPRIQRHSENATASSTEVPASVQQTLSGTGKSLEPSVRQEMEQRFGQDFSQVKIHAGASAAQSANDLNAHAYTVGRDIVFGAGKYAPQQQSGKKLLAHELTHVVQQSAGASAIQRSDRDPDEVIAMGKEDEAIKARAKRGIASGKPAFAVHEVMWRLVKNYGLNEHFELNGSRYEKGKKGVVVELTGKGVRTTGTIVGGDEVLQRIANGQGAQVVKEIEAQIGKVDTARGTVDYVFIMGADAPKSNNKFYTQAKQFFKAEYPTATMFEDVRDLEGINQRINSQNKPVANLYIVSHAHPDGTMQFSLNQADQTPGQVQFSELKEANENQSLTQPKPDLVGFWTNVMIRGCNLGRSEAMLEQTKEAFGGQVRVIAPTHEQVYSGGKESMGGAFYEEPGLSKLSDDEAFKRIKAKPEYAFITDWDAMRKKLKRINTNEAEIVYEGEFPAKGKEMELLKSQQGAKTAANFTFGSSRIEGDQTLFTYTSKQPTKFGDIEIAQETPPTDQAAIEDARGKVSRPDAYAYKVRRVQSGVNLKVIVDIQQTEWVLYHAEIHKQGKGFNPSTGTKPWYADTDNP
jgi:hypothetical protein